MGNAKVSYQQLKAKEAHLRDYIRETRQELEDAERELNQLCLLYYGEEAYGLRQEKSKQEG